MSEVANSGGGNPEKVSGRTSLADAVAVGAFRDGGNVERVVGEEFADGATFEAGDGNEADTIIIDPSQMPVSVEMMAELGLTPPSTESVDEAYRPPASA